MKTYTKYLTKEYLKYLCINEGIFVFLYFIIDFIQKIPDFIEAQIPAGTVLTYFLSKTPLVVTQMTAPAALIAVIILFSTISRKNEITAVKAGGINLLRFIRPVLMVTLFICAGIFLLSEVVVPSASSKANQIWKVDVQKQDPGLFYGGNQIWYKKDDHIYWVRHFDGKKMFMEGITLFFFDESFRVVRKIDAESAAWVDGKWRLKKVAIQERKADGIFHFSQNDSCDMNEIESPETFMKRAKEPEEMSYWQLKQYARKVKEEGYDNKTYLVDLHLKTAIPFVPFIIVLTGIPLALSIRKGGTPLAVSLGIGICFFFILTLGFLRSLGLSEVLPPLVAAWIGNFIFFFWGSYFLLQIRR